jgi:hypothetical protein
VNAAYKTCKAGLMRRASATRAEADLRGLAKRAARMNPPTARMLDLLARARAHLEDQRAMLAEHGTHCDCGAS